jgi:hypothetical protein
MQYHKWTLEDVYFVTRQKENVQYTKLEEFEFSDDVHPSILKDERIQINKDGQSIELRRVAFYHTEQKKLYEFMSNNFEIDADKIADI